jgi:integrase/recombinase XerD
MARGLATGTLNSYRSRLDRFREYVRERLEDKAPNEVTSQEILEYVEYLRRERDNKDDAVNHAVTVLKCFYRAMVAMGHLGPNDNPMKDFPKMKGPRKRVPLFLSEEEVESLLNEPRMDTVLGLRDRAILTLFVGTGIRASECASLKDADVYLHPEEGWIKVTGKGGDERVIPLNEDVVEALSDYEKARGEVSQGEPFFRSRNKGGMSRNAMYERVRTNARRAGIRTRVFPHRLRHTFALQLAKARERIQVIRDLLGHRCVSSTNVYMRTTDEMLRKAVNLIGISRLFPRLPEGIIPNVTMPFQLAPQAFQRGGGAV